MYPLGLPLVRKINANLWEIRSCISSGIVRIFFTIEDASLVLLHGFIKKTQKTPYKELTLAISRLREFKEMNK
ncbi:type II toxin-antitoxin system RelE/ParE family toxin [Treponema denticola]|uniref:type II toxin-antitoxin system RelE/ParE family toxin n=1 Tax=Treponema denticola TaxID=158 RepID=UPI002107D4F2|nr:type II toxin-antitoxin system RelE/ParE family toxin [Treponema denticola]UTY25100.1 type II toxin-antitoxin system RelE/ParE family toxin [Treponema denticola]